MKKRLRLILSTGSAGLAVLWLAASWIAVDLLSPEPPGPESGSLTWTDLFSSRVPAGESPPAELLSPPLASLSLQAVLSVEDAIEVQGRWVMLDPEQGKVHSLEPATGVIRSFGTKGPGPGEFQDPVGLAHSDSILWVLNRRGLFLDRFDLEGEFRSRMRLEGGGCLAGLAKKLVTVEPHGPVVLRVCPTRLPGPGTLWVEAVQPSGRLKPLFSMPLGTPGSRRLHLLRQPAATARHRSIFLGTWDAPCIAELRDRDFPTRTWCLPDFGRAPTSAGDREALERRFRRITALGLLPLEIPDLLPWYDEIFPIPNGLVIRRIRGEETRDLVVLDQGGPVRVLGSGLPPTTFVGEESVMTATQTMEGSRIEIYPVPWGRDEEDGSG